MTHRVGSLVPVSPTRIFQVGSGTDLGGGVWQQAFVDPGSTLGPAKFLILHFTSVSLGAGDRLEIDLGNGDTDVFGSVSGPDVWTRPVKGDTAIVRIVDGGGATATATFIEYGRGEGIFRGGADGGANISVTGGNANGDIFMLDSPFVDPPFVNVGGTCPPGTPRKWANVATLGPGVMRDVARSTGIFLEVGEGKVSSCSASVIGPDLILTAGHCVGNPTAIASGSFTLDYQTDAAGNRPAGYNPKFHKLKALRKVGFAAPNAMTDLLGTHGLDYAIIQIETPPGGLGVPVLQLRPDLPAIGEEVFLIHHPRAAAKKVSRKPDNPNCHVQIIQNDKIFFSGDLDNGSSGSPLFDLSGRLVGVNDWAGGCPTFGPTGTATGISAQAVAAILPDIASAVPPPADVDVMLVFDRSGSMSLPGLSGATKIVEARAAAALFIDLLRTDRSHRAGLVTFHTTAAVEQPLAPIAMNRDALIGPLPNRDGGAIAAIVPAQMTTIGGGLRLGRQQLVANPGANTPAILLMTDGLENTPPMIADVEAELANTRLCVIGFGTEGQLNGPLLTRLARDHGGIYTRANDGLALKKFFVLSFGNLFQTGIVSDPFFTLPAGSTTANPLPVAVCDEDAITVVLSWQNSSEELHLAVTTPSGTRLTRATPGFFSSSGATWVYFRIDLPFAGARSGTWNIEVSRDALLGELAAPLAQEPYFLVVTATGGPMMKPLPVRHRYYTGDVINPQVLLRYANGEQVDNATMTVEIESPTVGTGEILARQGMQAPLVVGGEPLDPRAGSLIRLEQANGGSLVTTSLQAFPLYDYGDRDGDNALEPNGIFGHPLQDVLRQEGHYTLHARATYGEQCKGTRETLWTVDVSVGLDPGHTKVEVIVPGGGAPGLVTVRITPTDRYGNRLGPGRADQLPISGAAGSTPTGPVRDRGDGSYDVDVTWDPGVSPQPGIVVSQPDRPPAVLSPMSAGGGGWPRGCRPWLWLLLALLLILVVLWIAL